MNTAAETKRELIGFDPGAEESQARNRIFVNLRAGRIGQTSNKPIEGFDAHTSKNKAGTVYNFFAKTYGNLTGFVNEIKWHTHTLNDGTELSGWNIEIDCGEKGVFVLGVNSKDRPFSNLMNCLINVDFTRPVRFVGFSSVPKGGGDPQKWLLLSQGIDPETKKEVWVQPGLEIKWLSRLIIDKLKANEPLTDDEKRNVSYLPDGKFNKDYPYITQNAMGKWSFEVYENFLFEQMNAIVIPNVQAAAEARKDSAPPAMVPEHDVPDYAGPEMPPSSDDDIPF